MKRYDLIVIGTGSALSVADWMIERDAKLKVAIIDKDEPGGICLTRGCIPSKVLLYPADLVRTIESAGRFGIDAHVKSIDFAGVMDRMRRLVQKDIDAIREGLRASPNIDYYHAPAEFVSPYTMKVKGETITSKMFILGTGSKTVIPKIAGLDKVRYHTSDTVLGLRKLPDSLVIVGGGYIAAEYGHFFSSMGSEVTIVGRNPRFIPEEEPEVSALARKELEKHMKILTNFEVTAVEETTGRGPSKKRTVVVTATDRTTRKAISMEASEVMIAAGRGPTTEILHPERAGIETDGNGWIVVNEYLETSQPNIWALGDADGKFPFKHVANYEAQIVFYNAVLKMKVKADYHAVPHAVFTDPEVAAVGMKEEEALGKTPSKDLLVGYYRYEDTAKGEAMDVKDFFVKVLVESKKMTILGAHIIGPQASVLIQEVVDMMKTGERSATTLNEAMHIHPALSEVVDRAFLSLMTVEQYHHMLGHTGLLVPPATGTKEK